MCLDYGVDKFVLACKERVRRFSDVITRQSVRLGQWMDWPNSYFTHTDLNIEGIHLFSFNQIDTSVSWQQRISAT